ncbi:hypothetical protein GCM10009332_18490 [Shewanella gelidii]|uniref:Uncharacterized protein n=1 Tax=Shewanella gelidii TaxID=1642821 RepID=A0A917NA22_9GAMM|nr:hypothetical protein GCM10009332_18490 [Shewanella gelidii]
MGLPWLSNMTFIGKVRLLFVVFALALVTVERQNNITKNRASGERNKDWTGVADNIPCFSYG